MRVTRIWLLTALLSLAVAGRCLGEVVAREGAGRLELVGGQTVVYLEGDHYEMGYQHGVLLRDWVRGVFTDYIAALEQSSGMFSEAKLIGVSQKYLLEHLTEEMEQELRGLAEGSGLSFEQVFAMQTFLDIISALWSNSVKGMRYLNSMCSSLAVRAPGTRGGELIHARNIDFPDYGVLSSHAVLFVYNPTRGRRHVVPGWAGLIGSLTGMNDAGVTLSEDTISTREDDIHGVPIMLLLRQALQHSDDAAALRDYIESRRRTTGYVVVTTSPEEQQVILMEFNPKRFVVFEPGDDGIIFATNHPRDPGMLSVYGDSRNSWLRYQRWEELTSAAVGEIDLEMVKSFLQDTFDVETGEDAGPAQNTICRYNNIQSAIFLPERLEFHLAQGEVPSAHGEWVSYSFDELFVDE